MCHGRKARMLQGSSSSYPNQNQIEENQEIPPFEFPGSQEKFEARELALGTLGHISDNNYTNELYEVGWCAGLVDISGIGRYDWGGTTMAHLYSSMDWFVTFGKKLRQLTGFYWILQFWWYEFLASCNHILLEFDRTLFPRVLLWETSNRLRILGIVSSNLVQAQQVIETRTIESIRWLPWVRGSLQLPIVQNSLRLSQQRVVLASPEVRVWYLGDKCARQIEGLIAIPYPPPRHMDCSDLTFPQSLARVARVANVDVVTTEALRPECQFTYPPNPDISSQGPHPIRDTQAAPEMDDFNLGVVSSQGLPLSLAISLMDPSSDFVGRVQSFDE
ncbi:hypothetical protein FRX31_010925, partial [Thalictrum thalictroides]